MPDALRPVKPTPGIALGARPRSSKSSLLTQRQVLLGRRRGCWRAVQQVLFTTGPGRSPSPLLSRQGASTSGGRYEPAAAVRVCLHFALAVRDKEVTPNRSKLRLAKSIAEPEISCTATRGPPINHGSTISKPRTWRNSRALNVATAQRRCRAVAATIKSWGPIIWPEALSCAQIFA